MSSGVKQNCIIDFSANRTKKYANTDVSFSPDRGRSYFLVVVHTVVVFEFVSNAC